MDKSLRRVLMMMGVVFGLNLGLLLMQLSQPAYATGLAKGQFIVQEGLSDVSMAACPAGFSDITGELLAGNASINTSAPTPWRYRVCGAPSQRDPVIVLRGIGASPVCPAGFTQTVGDTVGGQVWVAATSTYMYTSYRVCRKN